MSAKLIFEVASLLEGATGRSEDYSIKEDLQLEGIILKKPITAHVSIMRIEDGVAVTVTDLSTEVELGCDKCLEPFVSPVTATAMERVFEMQPPREIEDENDLHLIDMKRQEVDIAEMLRQEIILHFPVDQVCSLGCQGLCQDCGTNLNEKKCTCSREEIKPKQLSQLKDLLK